MGEAIDQVRLNFNPQAQLGLSLVLALVMFGIALDLRVADFKAALKTPKALAIGLVSHHLLFPAFTFLLIQAVRPLPSIALGMLLVVACGDPGAAPTIDAPGGVIDAAQLMSG